MKQVMNKMVMALALVGSLCAFAQTASAGGDPNMTAEHQTNTCPYADNYADSGRDGKMRPNRELANHENSSDSTSSDRNARVK